jgi:anti-sigma factor RsiW
MRNKAATCPRCGTRHDEWDADRDAYVGATHYCRGDDVLAMAQEALPKDKDGRTLPGFVAYLEPRDVAEARAEAKATAPAHD